MLTSFGLYQLWKVLKKIQWTRELECNQFQDVVHLNLVGASIHSRQEILILACTSSSLLLLNILLSTQTFLMIHSLILLMVMIDLLLLNTGGSHRSITHFPVTIRLEMLEGSLIQHCNWLSLFFFFLRINSLLSYRHVLKILKLLGFHCNKDFYNLIFID